MEYSDASTDTRWDVLWLSLLVHSASAVKQGDSGCCPIASMEHFTYRRNTGAHMGICRLNVSLDKLQSSYDIGSFGVGSHLYSI